MYKTKFTLSDTDEVFEGYTDGSDWNGWLSVFMTKVQVIEFLNSTHLDYRFVRGGVRVYWEKGQEKIYNSTPIPVDGKILHGFALEDFEFVEKRNNE